MLTLYHFYCNYVLPLDVLIDLTDIIVTLQNCNRTAGNVSAFTVRVGVVVQPITGALCLSHHLHQSASQSVCVCIWLCWKAVAA